MSQKRPCRTTGLSCLSEAYCWIVPNHQKLFFAIYPILEVPRLRTAYFDQNEQARKITHLVSFFFGLDVSDLDATQGYGGGKLILCFKSYSQMLPICGGTLLDVKKHQWSNVFIKTLTHRV